MSRPTPPSYKTRTWPVCNDALKQRGPLTIWLDPEMVWVPPPTGKRGRRKTLAVSIPSRGSQDPLHLLIDSTGIMAEGEGEWHARKHGGPKRRLWRRPPRRRRADAGVPGHRDHREPCRRRADAARAARPDPADLEIGSVTADGAFDTRKCHDAVADCGAHAFGHSLGTMAVMPSLPPRKNAKPWKPSTAGAIARNEALRASKYLGRAIWRKWSARNQ